MVTGPNSAIDRACWWLFEPKLDRWRGSLKPAGRFQAHGSDKEIGIARWKPDRENLASGIAVRELMTRWKATSSSAARPSMIVEILAVGLRNAERCGYAHIHGILGRRGLTLRVGDIQAAAVVFCRLDPPHHGRFWGD